MRNDANGTGRRAVRVMVTGLLRRIEGEPPPRARSWGTLHYVAGPSGGVVGLYTEPRL